MALQSAIKTDAYSDASGRRVSLPLITFFFDRLAHVIQSTLMKTLICKKNIKIIIDGWLFVIKGWSKHIRLQNGN